jgi:hydrogenase maturation protein HypF
MKDTALPFEKTARFLNVRGIVQGVGFRPFVYTLATRHDLSGSVRNTSQGVEILVEGLSQEVEAFILELRISPPPLARIDSVNVTEREPSGLSGFTILDSQP